MWEFAIFASTTSQSIIPPHADPYNDDDELGNVLLITDLHQPQPATDCNYFNSPMNSVYLVDIHTHLNLEDEEVMTTIAN